MKSCVDSKKTAVSFGEVCSIKDRQVNRDRQGPHGERVYSTSEIRRFVKLMIAGHKPG